MSQVNKKVETLRKFFADSQASNHPIAEHPVSKVEEYVRDLYLDMLCVIAQYECEDPERGFMLIHRIMAACENLQSWEEYLRRSLEITKEKAAEFVKQCKDNQLCESFLLDALLISCSNGVPNEKQVVFLAQFGDMLGLEKTDMDEIAKFVLTILNQDSDKYQTLLNDGNATLQERALVYAKEFVVGLIICTSKKRYYYAKKLSEYVIPENALNENGFMEISTGNEVKFENLIIHNMEKIDLKMIKNVVFENCHCMRGPLKLTSIDNILIDHCEFWWEGADNECKGFYVSNRAIKGCLQDYQMKIINTNFSGYKVRAFTDDYWYSKPDYFSAAIFFNDNEKNSYQNYLIFDNCDFSDITALQSFRGSYGNWAIYYEASCCSRVEVTNCHFSNCRNYNARNGLFRNLSKSENNVLVNSNPLK